MKQLQLLPSYVLDLIEVIQEAVVPLNIPYAIGGAVALNAHGYRRQTDDVDLFINDEDRPAVLRALRAQGLLTSAIFPPHMFIAKFPAETNPDIRIDVLVPADDPEISAIEMPERAKSGLGDAELNIFSAEWLALAKFYSDRPEDHRDLQRMWQLGLFDIPEAQRLLGLMDSSALDDFAAELKSFQRKGGRPKPPRRER